MVCGYHKEQTTRVEPRSTWDGGKDSKFHIDGMSDSDNAAKTDDRRSISGGIVFLENCPISFKSATLRFVTLSVMAAKSAAGVMVVQDMLHTYWWLK